MRRVFSLYSATVGKKIVMAVSGAVFVGFVLGHMVGNLKVFQGADKFNAYAEGLRTVGAPFFGHGQLLWVARLILLASLLIHVVSALQLSRRSLAARPVRYEKSAALEFSRASRSMRWGGVALLLFVAYHLAHLTWGLVHPDFIPGDAYHNLVSGFQSLPVAGVYVLAMGALGLHLYHGIWSAFQTLGLLSPRALRIRRPLATVVALAVVLGNLSFPVAVQTGLLAL
ncbi:MAG: succinate dehydrogenase cytochrome b subunit [Gemmatimonadota bacterium]